MELIFGFFALGFIAVACLRPNATSALFFELLEYPKIRAWEAAQRAQAGPQPEWMPSSLIGRKGVVLEGLRLSGKIARDCGEQLDVVSVTGVIEAGRRVVVRDQDGARVHVSLIAATA